MIDEGGREEEEQGQGIGIEDENEIAHSSGGGCFIQCV